MQTVADVDVPAAVCTVPAAQVPWGRHCDWLLPLEYWPVGQVTHTRSAVDDGVFDTYVPAWHVLQAVQLGALFTLLNWPLVQAAQVRSLVVVPWFETYLPGAQVVLATHGVKGFPSGSQVSAAHDDVVPAGLNATNVSLAFGCTSSDWAMNDPRWVRLLAVPIVRYARGATMVPRNGVSRTTALVPMYSTKSREGSAPLPSVGR
jgi:hypothetical protein